MKRFFLPLITFVAWTALSASPVNADTLNGWVDYADVYRLSPGVAGRVASVSVTQGDRVLKGTRLVSLEARSYEAAVAAARANTAAIKAEHDEVTRALDRDQQLYDEGSLSAVALDQRRIEGLQAAAALATANRDLANAQLALSLSHIDAPIDGTVVSNELAVGEVVSPHHTAPSALVIAGFDRHVSALVDPAAVAAPPLGSRVTLAVAGEEMTGLVASVDSGLVPGRLQLTITVDGKLPEVGQLVAITF